VNRRLMLVTVIAVTLTLTIGLINSIRLYAASSSTAAKVDQTATSSDAGFIREPVNQGKFTQADSTTTFYVEVRHTGNALSDIIDLSLESSWPAALYGPDGLTPLSDTNGSGDVDTGALQQGQPFVITAKVSAPSHATVGEANDAILTLQSTVSPTLVMTALMQSAIPAPFAQSLYEQSDRDISLVMSQPNGTWRAPANEDKWYGNVVLAEMAVAETISGYVYIWNNLYGINNVFFNELEYTLTNKSGQRITNIKKLTDHSSATYETWDTEPAVDVSPNGNIGVSWAQRMRQEDGSELYNVYLAILDSDGQPITNTINLTDNATWRAPGGQPGFDAPLFRSPSVAATGDNHFFVAWEKSVVTYTEQVTQTYTLDDVYYAILASDGISVTDAINISNNVPGAEMQSRMPAMTGVKDDRVFLTWAQRHPGSDDIQFAVIDSSNTIIRPSAGIADDDQPVEWSNSDVVELSNGRIIASWIALGCPEYEWSPRIRYAVFLPNNYNQAGQPACLPPTIVAKGGDDRVSLVPDNQARAIVTWTSSNGGERSELYYALLKSNGLVLTDPMIFYDSGISGSPLSPGVRGYASASRIFLDTAIEIDPTVEQGISEELIPFAISYRNYGAVTGTDVVITMSLAPSLSYYADNAPITPTIDGQTISWTLPDAAPWSEESFQVQVTIKPGATLLGRYPLTATIGVGGQESDLANNSAQAEVVVRLPTFVPLIIKQD